MMGLRQVKTKLRVVKNAAKAANCKIGEFGFDFYDTCKRFSNINKSVTICLIRVISVLLNSKVKLKIAFFQYEIRTVNKNGGPGENDKNICQIDCIIFCKIFTQL